MANNLSNSWFVLLHLSPDQGWMDVWMELSLNPLSPPNPTPLKKSISSCGWPWKVLAFCVIFIFIRMEWLEKLRISQVYMWDDKCGCFLELRPIVISNSSSSSFLCSTCGAYFLDFRTIGWDGFPLSEFICMMQSEENI